MKYYERNRTENGSWSEWKQIESLPTLDPEATQSMLIDGSGYYIDNNPNQQFFKQY